MIPDSHNRFRLPGEDIVSAVRVDVFPDGGFSRLHLIGELADEALAEAIANWLRLLPSAAYARMLARAGIRAGAGPHAVDGAAAQPAW